MPSFLETKLEALRVNEERIKEQQRVLQEERQVLLEEIMVEQDNERLSRATSTIEKLHSQIGALSNNIAGNIMSDNFEVVIRQQAKDIKEIAERRDISGEERYILIREAHRKLGTKMVSIGSDLFGDESIGRTDSSGRTIRLIPNIFPRLISITDNDGMEVILPKITPSEFLSNWESVSEETRQEYPEYGTISPVFTIYRDIIPLFTTMLNILEKQQKEINVLKIMRD